MSGSSCCGARPIKNVARPIQNVANRPINQSLIERKRFDYKKLFEDYSNFTLTNNSKVKILIGIKSTIEPWVKTTKDYDKKDFPCTVSYLNTGNPKNNFDRTGTMFNSGHSTLQVKIRNQLSLDVLTVGDMPFYELTPISPDELRELRKLRELRELKGGKKKKVAKKIKKKVAKKKVSAKKKVAKKKVSSKKKKVGVYRTPTGRFYRRFQNGTVKRISNESYKKLKLN